MTFQEFEQELEGAFEQLEWERASYYPRSEREVVRRYQGMPPTRCPPDSLYTIRGFGRYRGDTRGLPDDQYGKFKLVAAEINRSLSGAPGVRPVTQVVVVGHADLDLARERREPGFLQFISEKRAFAAMEHLSCRVESSLTVKGPSFNVVGRGARALAVPNSRTEPERKCNRRVEIMLIRSPQPPPQLNASQRLGVEAEKGTFKVYYHIALQGTSGQYERPEVAAKKAREIAERVPPFLEQRAQYRKKRGIDCLDRVGEGGFDSLFKDALQGTASKFSDPDVVIDKASEIAEASELAGMQAFRKLEWKYTTLPQPMAGDCESGGRVPGGPISHFFCRQHGHILDTGGRKVIAHDLEEYKRLFQPRVG